MYFLPTPLQAQLPPPRWRSCTRVGHCHIVKQQWQVTITPSPSLILGFTLGFWQMYDDLHPPWWELSDYFHCPLRILWAPPSCLSSATTLATPDLFTISSFAFSRILADHMVSSHTCPACPVDRVVSWNHMVCSLCRLTPFIYQHALKFLPRLFVLCEPSTKS